MSIGSRSVPVKVGIVVGAAVVALLLGLGIVEFLGAQGAPQEEDDALVRALEGTETPPRRSPENPLVEVPAVQETAAEPPPRRVEVDLQPPGTSESGTGTAQQTEPAVLDEREGPRPRGTPPSEQPGGSVLTRATPRSTRILADRTGGMAEVDGTKGVEIGSQARQLARSSELAGGFAHGYELDAPRHRVDLEDFLIDRFEVTNQQWFVFLQDDALLAGDREIEPRAGETLHGIAQRVVTRDIPENIDWDQVAFQLYMANRDVLHARWGVGTPVAATEEQERATFESLTRNGVDSRLRLVFYDRPPPPHWRGMRPPLRETDHPVHGISFYEACAFAAWAGKYVPTEFEWEYVAAGKRGRRFPWLDGAATHSLHVNQFREDRPEDDPITVAYNSHPQAQTQLGVFNLLGNVSEWTSSPLLPYPEAPAALVAELTGGSRALVVRGGSALDRDTWLLRNQARGWTRRTDDPAADAPRPNVRRPFTGLRLAANREESDERITERGHSRVRLLAGLVDAHGAIQPGLVDTTVPAGFARRGWVAAGQPIEAGVFVASRGWSMAAAPLTVAALYDEAQGLWSGALEHTIHDRHSLIEASRVRPVLLGALSTDLPLRGFGLPAAGAEARVVRATIPPGEYVIGIISGYVALIESRRAEEGPPLMRAFVLNDQPLAESQLAVRDVSARRRRDGRKTAGRWERLPLPRCEMGFRRSDLPRDLELRVPLGGAEGSKAYVLLRVGLDIEIDSDRFRDYQADRLR